MEAWTTELGNDDQSKTGDKEKEIIHELELTATSHVQAEKTEFVEDEFITWPDVQLRIGQEVEKRTTKSMKEATNKIVEDSLIVAIQLRSDTMPPKRE